MLIQIVHLIVKPENLDTFLIEVCANARESLKEPGVRRFEVLQHSDYPDKFMLYEVYENSEALEAHRKTPQFKRWQDYGVPLLAVPRERVLYKPVFPEGKE